MEQLVLENGKVYTELDQYLISQNVKRLLLVCGKSIRFLRIGAYFDTLEARIGVHVVKFTDFTPNPKYEEIVKGVERFRNQQCDAVFAVGGGSAIDVAKCIKAFAGMGLKQNYLKQPIVSNEVKLFAMPTTAGTGSEATRFAVIYYEGNKQSVEHESLIPSLVLMEPSALDRLPIDQRKATMLDALCHAIESFWSVNSTEESRKFSAKAMQLIIGNYAGYLGNQSKENANMLKAAYIAGKAINITQTTAGHAMCYKLTTLYSIAHGCAAALCVAKLWRYMLLHTNQCADKRGEIFLKDIFGKIAEIFSCADSMAAADRFQGLIDEIGITAPRVQDNREYEILCRSVNSQRLKNNPVRLDENAIDLLYHQILK